MQASDRWSGTASISRCGRLSTTRRLTALSASAQARQWCTPHDDCFFAAARQDPLDQLLSNLWRDRPRPGTGSRCLRHWNSLRAERSPGGWGAGRERGLCCRIRSQRRGIPAAPRSRYFLRWPGTQRGVVLTPPGQRAGREDHSPLGIVPDQRSLIGAALPSPLGNQTPLRHRASRGRRPRVPAGTAPWSLTALAIP